MTDLAPVLQGFFTDRLARQKKASPNTVAAYRDTCRLLLAFARDQTGKPPSQLSLTDLDAALVGAFLNHLEDQRGNGSATRNARLAAIHSLFKYAAPKAPEHAAVISQVLAIPPRRRERAIVSYLTPKDRATPLTTQTARVMRIWLAELSPDPAGPLFPTQPGGRLSRDAVERLVARHAAAAAEDCPSIGKKHVTPHTLRHYVEGRVMWPAASSPLVAEPRVLVPAT